TNRFAHNRNGLVGGCGGAERGEEIFVHEVTRKLRQHGEVFLGSSVGCGDHEADVAQVAATEVDAWREASKGERRLRYGRGLRVRDRDATRQAGRILFFAGPGGGEELFGVPRAAYRDKTGRDRAQLLFFIGTQLDIEADKRPRDR